MDDVKKLFDLSGKNAVITGGAGVLASIIAEGLGRAGARVAICDLAVDRGKEAVKELEGKGINAKAYEWNVLKEESIPPPVIYMFFFIIDRTLSVISRVLSISSSVWAAEMEYSSNQPLPMGITPFTSIPYQYSLHSFLSPLLA